MPVETCNRAGSTHFRWLTKGPQEGTLSKVLQTSSGIRRGGMMPSRVSFRLVKPLVAFTKSDSKSTTIPSGAMVEVVHPAVGDSVDVQWDGVVHCVSLNNLLRACREDLRERWDH